MNLESSNDLLQNISNGKSLSIVSSQQSSMLHEIIQITFKSNC